MYIESGPEVKLLSEMKVPQAIEENPSTEVEDQDENWELISTTDFLDDKM